jgi:hypothetical protein
LRQLTPGEILSLREFLTMETTGLVTLKTSEPLISDQKLKQACNSGITAAEGRIRALQQFIQENGVADIQGVQQ